MTYLLAAVIAFTVLAFVWHLDRKDRRTVDAINRLTVGNRDELQVLLQRIQAPERAVVEHENRDVDMTPAPPIDPLTDEAWREQLESLAEVAKLEQQANADFDSRLA